MMPPDEDQIEQYGPGDFYFDDEEWDRCACRTCQCYASVPHYGDVCVACRCGEHQG
jgi:hypothetical protein